MTDIISHSNDTKKGSDEDLGSNSPFSDTNFEDGGFTAVKSMCNSTAL